MLTAAEYHMHEALPLYRVQQAILEFCRGRPDIVVFGAQAVNVHVPVPRMSQDVDLLSPRSAEVAAELARTLGAAFHVAMRVREVAGGKGFRVYQVRKEGNRHLADVRQADFPLDDAVDVEGVRYVAVPLAVAMKVCALVRRRLSPKGGTDLADLRRLLLAHPGLRSPGGPVGSALERLGAGSEAREAWRQLLAEPIVSDEETDEEY